MSDDHFQDIGGGISVILADPDTDAIDDKKKSTEDKERLQAFNDLSRDISLAAAEVGDPLEFTPTTLPDTDPHLDFFLKNKS